MFESTRILIGGHEFLKLFPFNPYASFITMMLNYTEDYRTTYFRSLGELSGFDYYLHTE